jgi:iron complex transport system ATP-binding protein
MLSAYGLVALGRYPHTNWAGTLTEHDHQVIRHAMQTVNAQDLAARPVAELSDGERQKVMVARALAQEPDVMILDEITAFLDLPRRVEVMRLLQTMARTAGKAILLSTHDLDLALRNADRVWLLRREAPMVAGAPEDLVLSGALADTFRSEGIEFDRNSGAFEVSRTWMEDLVLTGTGTEAWWTERALVREGYRVHRDGRESSGLRVEVTVADQGLPTWHVRTADRMHACASLYELTLFLRAAIRNERRSLRSVSSSPPTVVAQREGLEAGPGRAEGPGTSRPE